ncbi:MAG: tetratricopeptide repeat protein [Rubrivivax sp.]|nr:tetratricopeptide repeat protein [Rubrivivax sp.]
MNPHSRAWAGSPLRNAIVALAFMVCGSIALAQQPALDKQIASLLAEQKWGEALALIDTQLKTRPNDTSLLMNRGAVLSNLDRNGDALATFQKVASINPQLPAVHNNIAVIQAAMGRYEDAKAALERAIRIQPAYATAYENLGDLYAHMAGDAYRRALQIDKTLKTAKAKLEMATELTSFAAGAPPGASAAPPSGASPGAAPGSRPAALAPADPAVVAAPSPSPPAPAPAAAPAAAAPAATASAAAAARAAAASEVEAALKAWARAWSARDVAAYTAAYVPGFKGRSATHEAWLADRRARLEARSRIAVTLTDIRVTVLGDRADAQFRQAYESDSASTRSRKKLVLQRIQGQWLIREESGQ